MTAVVSDYEAILSAAIHSVKGIQAQENSKNRHHSFLAPGKPAAA
jgi:hypothetical protein